MITSELNLSMATPTIQQAFAKEGDTGRVLKINLIDAEPENGTLRILRPDGVEVTADAIKSASGDAYKGDLVTFDALEEVRLTKAEVTLESSQDLHGQSSPYPAGGGKNLLPNTSTSGSGSGITRVVNADGTISLSDTSSGLYLVAIGTITLPSGTYAVNGCPINSNSLTLQLRENNINGTTLATDSGNGATITLSESKTICACTRIPSGQSISTPLIVKPMIRLASVTDATYAPYSNICPIEPSNGKNLLNNTASSSSPSGITFTVNADGTVTATGTATADAQLQIPFSGLSGDYYFCGCPSGGNASTKYDVYAWDNTASARFKKWNGTTNSASDVGTYSLQEVQIPSGHSGYIVIRIKSGYAIQGSLLFKPMIVVSTETSNIYVPYQGINVYHSGEDTTDYTTYPLSLGQNVYGGTLDVVSGKLMVTHKYFSYTSASLYGDYYDHPLYYVDIADYSTEKIAKKAVNTDNGYLLSNYFTQITTSSYYYMGNCEIRTQDNDTTSKFYFRYDNVADLTTLNSMLSTTPLVVVAKLQTPIEYDLTPTQISTLLGENNIWSSGEVEVAFEYDGLFAQLPQQATAVVGKCIGDVNFTDISTLPFILTVKENQA